MEHLRTVAIIQARMSSTRLRYKVLADIKGQPMLLRVLQRTRKAQCLDDVVVATTTNSADAAIVAFCHEHGFRCFRGSEEDVLDRYYEAARSCNAQTIVRITSDCPFIDSAIIETTVHAFQEQPSDYASNCVVRTHPRGLDTEVFSFEALERAWLAASKSYQRAHVTPYIYENPDKFRILSVTGERDYSEYRWTVDTIDDLQFVRTIYSRLQNSYAPWRDVVTLLEREPELADINRGVKQKALHLG